MSSVNSDLLSPLKVLLIEDNRDHQVLIKYQLLKMGINEVIVANTGEQGIEFIRRDTDYFDIVIVDYSLPGKSGLEVIQQISEISPLISTLMITGQGSERIAVEAMKAGVEDYITKEEIMKSDLLTKTLKKVIRKREESVVLKVSKQLTAEPKKLSVSIFRFGKYGPEPVYTSPLPFEMSPEKETSFYLKIGLYYMTSIGAGHTFAQGLYELPVPEHDDYHGLVYGYKKYDHYSEIDDRFQNKGENYGLIVIIYPRIFRRVIPDLATLEHEIGELLKNFESINDLAQPEFIDKIRMLFMKKQI